MQSEVTFVIDEQGDCKYLLTDAAKAFDLGGTPRRASHVEPANAYLRLAFQGIRKLVADTSWAAQWTRGWPCFWRVNLGPIGGPILPVHYTDRHDAIDAEIVAIHEFWLQNGVL
jgi:hypothetical protein